MQAYVGTFRLRAGTGGQTVTGIVDANGAEFVPKIIMFQSGGNRLNTLYYNETGLFNTSASDKSWYRAADNSAGAAASAEYPFNHAIKITGGNTGTGVNSVFTSYEADIFFAGTLYRHASMTSVGLGQFTIALTANTGWFEPTDVMIAVFGGDDFETQRLAFGAAGAYPTAFESKGFYSPRIGLAATGFNANGASNAIGGFGWDSPNGGAQANCCHIGYNTINWRYQRTIAHRVDINSGAGTVAQSGAISAWGPTSVSIPTPYSVVGLSVGGDGVLTASGVLTEPLTTGPQSVNLGIAAKWIMFSSVGAAPSSALSVGTAQMLCGWGTPTGRQASYWYGETHAAPVPLKGAALLADDYIIRIASAGAQAAATAFDGLARLVALNTDGTADLEWDAVTGDGTEIIWFAIGEATSPEPPPPPAPVSVEHVLRRLRRSSFVAAEDVRVYHHGFALDLETGVGLTDGQGADPQLMLRYSDDGGHTWSDEAWASAGARGAYRWRAEWRRLGYARNRVYEVTISDPVKVALLEALLALEPGQS